VTVPVAEELAFRGYLARRLMTADFESIRRLRSSSWQAVLASSVLFGALHGMPLATLAGIAFAWCGRRNDRLLDAVVAHSAANTLLAAYVLTTGSWRLWE
jgi:CAAX prenyl protease-like protein